jgi:tetratricopeptide (TPR) repeat protein
MSSPKRNRARVLTASGLKKLREQIRSHEVEENAGFKYTLERLGELTGLDPETVKNVLDCKGSDKRTIARCFESFGLTLEDGDHISAAQVSAAPSDPGFVGRDEAIADLNALVSRNTKVIMIQARGGVGKTTLARKYLQQEFGSFLEFPIAKETKDIASIEGLIEEKLRQLGEEPGREFLVSLDRLKRKLQAERIGILIDNLEPALDTAGRFIEPHRRYVELIRVLSDPTVRSITLITSRERLREVDVTVQHYGLRSLDVKAWEEFFQGRGINAETPALAALHNAYGGNAKAMDIVSSAVLEDFSGDVETYWQANQDDLFIERDLEDLVTKQFDRLQQLDPDAYKFLCRMGCYRYQDIPTIRIEGLFSLLWDVLENRHRRVIKSLQDRSLIDFECDEFWLHPVIRAEAIARLRTNGDWEIANRKAAEYWVNSIETIQSTKDALKVLEAYYQYLEISDLRAAADILLKKLENEWHQNLPLCAHLYRLGLLQQSLIAINQVINYQELELSPIELSTLVAEIANVYWMLGKVQEAIKKQEEARKIVSKVLNSGDKESRDRALLREVYYLLSIGIYKIDLWELEEASELFKIVISKAEEISLETTVALKALASLAFVESTFENNSEICNLVNKANDEIEKSKRFGIGNFNFWGLYLGSAYKNIGNYSTAKEIFNRILTNIAESPYRQSRIKAFIALAEIYRSQSNFSMAISNHLESIEALEKIGVKCDLGEAYHQLGLTYKAMSEDKRSHESFQNAIQMFSEMNAPKQVARVRQSMQS